MIRAITATEDPPHPQLAADDEQLPLPFRIERGRRCPAKKIARDRDPRLEHDVAELPRALAVVGERAEVVHPQHPLARPERRDDLVGREVVLAAPEHERRRARVAARSSAWVKA